jgi:LemA protein
MILLIILGIFFLFIIYIISIYNSLVKLKNQCEEAFSSIDVQLKRRHDLIPNLVETVKGYAKHEKETFTKVTEARNMAMAASGDIAKRAEAENFLTNTLKSLFALSENYPELKANENFLQLQNSLNEIENNIQNARRYYNAVVRDLNTKIESFPSNIIAQMFNFKKREYFEIEESEKEPVKVSFQ